ncbi:MAG: hypothetical protein ACREUC_16210, partial [Steroidobacteraceae bacterium]
MAIVAVAALCAGCGGDATSDPAASGTAPAAEGAATSAVKKAAAAIGIPTYREVTLPAGTTLPLELKTAVASDTSQIEDSVRASLRRAITID